MNTASSCQAKPGNNGDGNNGDLLQHALLRRAEGETPMNTASSCQAKPGNNGDGNNGDFSATRSCNNGDGNNGDLSATRLYCVETERGPERSAGS